MAFRRTWLSDTCLIVAVTLLAVAAILGLAAQAHADAGGAKIEIFGEIEFEGTVFAEDPQFVPQERDDASVAGKLTFQAQWWDGDLSLRVTPFARLDLVDDRRTHFDLREAKLDLIEGDWSFTVGVDTLFWGKTEAVHLVDIINQTDAVEGLDDEGRLRTNPAVNTAAPVYDTGAEEWTPSFAVRYAGVFGDVDLGLSAFHGLGRDPAFFFDGVSLRPFYERITQFGVDVQYTSDATLWKGEGIWRLDQKNARFIDEDFVALTGGLEHTLYGIFETNADLGLIAEYAWDSRGKDALTTFQNDLILGTRLALNDEADTALLLTGAVDMSDGAVGLRLEADRRIAENWTLGVEGQAFLNNDRTGIAGSFADDHFLRVKLTYFFGLVE